MPQKDLLAVCTIGRLNNRRESGTIKRFTYPETFHAFLDQDKNQIVFQHLSVTLFEAQHYWITSRIKLFKVSQSYSMLA